jgi:hypothetical protein
MLLNDRPGRLTQPDRVFGSCVLMLGDELAKPWQVPALEGLSALVDALYPLRTTVIKKSDYPEKEALGACHGLAAWSATSRSAR